MIKQYIVSLNEEFKGYNSSRLAKDTVAGITVAAVSLPLALAFAVSSGLSAAIGLVTAIVSGLVIGTLAGASYQISGPTGTMAGILIIVAQKYGLEGVFVVTFLAGSIRLLAGLLRFGKVVYLIPAPVVTGFTSGIAIIIATGQIDNFFGVTSEGTSTLGRFMFYFQNGFPVQLSALFIGVVVIGLMVFWPKRWNAKVPSSLIGLIFALGISQLLKLPVDVVGTIPKTLILENRLHITSLTTSPISELMMPAMSIAALGMIESLLCGSAAGRMKDERFNANQELLAQGIGNMIIPFFGGMPATAALARTSVAIKAGGQTRLAGVIHSMTLIICMFLLGDLMAQIPLAALAGVLIVTAFRMNEWESIRFIFKKRLKTAMAQFLITMIATVIFDLTIAIVLGVIFSVLLFVVRSAEIEINMSDIDIDKLEANGISIEYHHRRTKVVYLTGSVFFATAEKLNSEILSLEDLHYIIVSMRGVSLIDTTGVQMLTELCERLRCQGTKVLFAGVQPKVRDQMARGGMIERVGEKYFFWGVEQSIVAIEEHMQEVRAHNRKEA